MKIAILGTGMVGRTLAHSLLTLSNEIFIGTRNPSLILIPGEKDSMDNPSFGEWHQSHTAIKVGTFSEAANFGEIVFNATSGRGTIEALKSAGKNNLANKILIDISNPLDFSRGFPPSLFISNTDSLAEQIQREFSKTKVVKTLNTLSATLMVNPKSLHTGDHSLFISGNDKEAKRFVTDKLLEWFGWQDVIDLGDISTARGTEMLLPLWVRLMSCLGSSQFNFKIVK